MSARFILLYDLQANNEEQVLNYKICIFSLCRKDSCKSWIFKHWKEGLNT